MISACASRFERGCRPIVAASRGSWAVVLFDGVASWGSGAEAAASVRARLARLLRRGLGLTPHVVAKALAHLVTDLPAQIREDEWGWSFSVAVAVAQGNVVQVGVSGAFSVVAALGGAVQPLWMPPRLIDELVARGHVRSEDAEQHELRHIHTGPFFGEHTELTWLDPIELQAGSKVALGHAALARLVQHGSVQLDGDAASLRDAVEAHGGGSFATAVVDAQPCPQEVDSAGLSNYLTAPPRGECE